MIGGTEKDPIVVMNAALASSGVLISPLMTFDIECLHEFIYCRVDGFHNSGNRRETDECR
jgi:hypothetical protein